MKINRLSQKVYSLIAAGEIIERPSSVVRELMQNALDAGADNIIVEVNEGGKTLIRITDNGSGMSHDDLLICTEPHSTSKIKSSEDINSINTYGFRGEALHAISSVSLLSIDSCEKNSGEAYSIELKEGHIINDQLSSLHDGTSIAVDNIFYNLPARSKFMKSANIELNHCIREFEHLAMVNPQVIFKFISNGNVLQSLNKTDIEGRLKDINGDYFIENSYSIDYMSDRIHVLGYIGKPDIFSDKKSKISYMFINRRYVFNPLVRRALYTSFDTQLAHRTVPYIIYIELPPEELDVNIHPAKKEVKFRNEGHLFPVIINAVRSAVQVYAVKQKNTDNDETIYQINRNEEHSEQSGLFETFELSSNITGNRDSSYFYQFKNKYIITKLKNRLYIVDQHAAHERIMYEKFIANKSNLNTQKLLFSFTVKMDADSMELYDKIKDMLSKSGFQTRTFGRDVILVEGIPSLIENHFDANDFNLLMDDIRKNENIAIIDEIIKMIACRSAVKAGKKLSEYEMAKIFSDLFSCSNPFACPHGRPTLKYFEEEEVEKWFKRQ